MLTATKSSSQLCPVEWAPKEVLTCFLHELHLTTAGTAYSRLKDVSNVVKHIKSR